MKNYKVVLAVTTLSVMSFFKAGAQGMAVNNSGSAANSSAMLDVSSTTQGMLVPRMTSAQRTAIATPATGLLVYQTDATAGFYFYNGTAWTSLSGGGGAPTGAAGGDLTGTYPNPTLAASGVTAGTYGSSTQVPAYVVDAKGRISAAANITVSGVTPGGAAGGDLTGTYPNPTVANSSITSAKILDGTITNTDISTSASIAYSKLNLSGSVATTDISTTGASSGQVLGYNGTNVAWTTPSGGGGGAPTGAAGGDLSGTYPNPTIAANAVTTAKISSAGATAGQVLGYNGTNVGWTYPTGTGAVPGGIPFFCANHNNSTAGSLIFNLTGITSGIAGTANVTQCSMVFSNCHPSLTVYGAGTSGNFPLTVSMVNISFPTTSGSVTIGSAIGTCVISSPGSTCSIDVPGSTLSAYSGVALTATNAASSTIVLNTAFSCQ